MRPNMRKLEEVAGRFMVWGISAYRQRKLLLGSKDANNYKKSFVLY
jgi:hypothetical protein